MQRNSNEHIMLLQKLMMMTPEEYANIVFESGITYLTRLLSYEEMGLKMLSNSPYYWEWWKRQWNRRNRILIHDYDLESYKDIEPCKVSAEMVRDAFDKAHDVFDLLSSIYPNKIVMEESYELMIHKMWKEEARKKFNKSN